MLADDIRNHSTPHSIIDTAWHSFYNFPLIQLYLPNKESPVMNQMEMVLHLLEQLNIKYEIYKHKPLPTIEMAMEVWKDIESTHCKNLFFRNHKGNRHYLVILESNHTLDIHDLEQRLRQGKISFASQKRLSRYLGVNAGSVSPFGLINDQENHVHVFLDQHLLHSGKISFHPNVNTASVVIDFQDFRRFLDFTGNTYEFLELY